MADVLEDLMTVLDMESYCPALRSIEITRWSVNQHTSDLTHELIDNSLVKISLSNYTTKNRRPEINVMITNLLTKHASSLRHLNISALYEEDMDFIVSTVIEKQICLRVFCTSQAMSSLISFISSSGDLLEVLEVINTQRPFNAEALVASVAASCPKLTRLVTSRCKPCSIETLRRLYEQCPHLQDVSIGSVDKVIETDEQRKSVSIEKTIQESDFKSKKRLQSFSGESEVYTGTLPYSSRCLHHVRDLLDLSTAGSSPCEQFAAAFNSQRSTY
eukprot:scaffold2278_cov171-Ochromonas_danica.AAC.3